MKIQLQNNWQLTGSYGGFWEFGRSMELKMELKGVTPWIPAQVPGSVHWDLYQNGLIPDPYWNTNTLSVEWVNDRDWLYKVSFNTESSWKGRKVRLVCEGIDYSAKVRLNGEHLHEHTGMFTPAVIDLTSRLLWEEENTLLVGVAKSPDGQAQLGYTSKVDHLKSRFGYRWDFSPRLINIGLWKPVYLWVTGNQWFDDVHVTTEVTASGAIAHVNVTLENDLGGRVQLNGVLKGPDGLKCAEINQFVTARPGLQVVSLRIPIDNPELWWPNGYGKQPIYQLEMKLWNELEGGNEQQPSDERTVSFGIRTLDYSQNHGAPSDSIAFTIHVNDKKVYIKGWNWVPPDQLYGRNRPDQYKRLIQLAKAANINLLRIWGGGLIERELFYDLCDQAGIMVWQEMMQSSSGFNNEPSEEPAFMHLLQSTMRAVIREKRNHPSLVIWCGGNELTFGGHLADKMNPITDKHANIRMLRDLVGDLDPTKLFLPSSSTGPMFFLDQTAAGQGISYDVHGPWKYGGAVDHYTLYNTSDALLHSEYGGDGFASLNSIRKYMPEEMIDPAKSNSWTWLQHGYEYWNIDAQMLELFGGPEGGIEQRIHLGQWLQAEGIRYAVESNRRRAPRCSGSILWQMNEPFPNICCTSSVDYYGDPKLAYSWVALANRSIHISMEYEKIVFTAGEKFNASMFITADAPLPEELIIAYSIRDAAGTVMLEKKIPYRSHQSLTQLIGHISWDIPGETTAFFAAMDVYDAQQNCIIAYNEYAFAVRVPRNGDVPLLRSFIDIGHTHVTAEEISRDGAARLVRLCNTGENVALWTRLEGYPTEAGQHVEPQPIRPLFDGFILHPGEVREVEVAASHTNLRWKVSGLNVK